MSGFCCVTTHCGRIGRQLSLTPSSKKVSVAAHPAHTSDHLQPLNESVSVPSKQYMNNVMQERGVRRQQLYKRFVGVSGLDLLDANLNGCSKASVA